MNRIQQIRELHSPKPEPDSYSIQPGVVPFVLSRTVDKKVTVEDAAYMGLVSVCVVTMDRFELLQSCVGENLSIAGYPFELLCVDNGSKDYRVREYIADLLPVYHRLNPDNQGYAPMLNQMMLRANGNYICIMDPDLQLPGAWLRKLVEANKAIPESGVSGFHCVGELSPRTNLYHRDIHIQREVFGVKFFHKKLLETVGYFCEEFTPYGCEDADLYVRIQRIGGMKNYYLTEKAVHVGDDCGEKNEYREMKWASLRRASETLGRRVQYYDETGKYYIAPPSRT